MDNKPLVSCHYCDNRDAPHHMTKCTRCGNQMCPSCLYLKDIYSPSWCVTCRTMQASDYQRSRVRAVANEINAEANADLKECPIDSVAWGHADGRAEAARKILENI